MNENEFALGCHGDLDTWLLLNSRLVFEEERLRKFVSLFPPADLMHVTSGLVDERDFAAHGVHIYTAVHESSFTPILGSKTILDFGCGCGRLARLFKGFRGELHGCDIDGRLVDWMQRNLLFMQTKLSSVKLPLPYEDDFFHTIISISVFSHLTEGDQDLFLSELHRVAAPGAQVLLSIHGERALHRAWAESFIFEILAFDAAYLRPAVEAAAAGKHFFIRQEGHHLTNILGKTGMPARSDTSDPSISDYYDYGIAFIPEAYIQRHWSKFFTVMKVVRGAIHDFQDIVVLQKEAG